MKRAQYEQLLRQMEHCRELSYEADTVAEERRLTADYGRMWKAVEPYAMGALPFDDEPASQEALL